MQNEHIPKSTTNSERKKKKVKNKKRNPKVIIQNNANALTKRNVLETITKRVVKKPKEPFYFLSLPLYVTVQID